MSATRKRGPKTPKKAVVTKSSGGSKKRQTARPRSEREKKSPRNSLWGAF